MYPVEEEEEEEEHGSMYAPKKKKSIGSTSYTHIARRYLVPGFFSGYTSPFKTNPLICRILGWAYRSFVLVSGAGNRKRRPTCGGIFWLSFADLNSPHLLAICLPSLGSLCSLGGKFVCWSKEPIGWISFMTLTFIRNLSILCIHTHHVCPLFPKP